MDNQKGVTLIELLATIVIFGIFSTIIWAFVLQTFKTNDVEISKNQLQQESNTILNAIEEIHRKSDSYKIDFNRNEIIITPNNSTQIAFTNPSIIYDLSPLNTGVTITPKSQNLQLNLVLTSKDNENISTNVTSTFKRLK
ncbi:MAG: type II secretion system protein [Paenisporosarcina sp.]